MYYNRQASRQSGPSIKRHVPAAAAAAALAALAGAGAGAAVIVLTHYSCVLLLESVHEAALGLHLGRHHVREGDPHGHHRAALVVREVNALTRLVSRVESMSRSTTGVDGVERGREGERQKDSNIRRTQCES